MSISKRLPTAAVLADRTIIVISTVIWRAIPVVRSTSLLVVISTATYQNKPKSLILEWWKFCQFNIYNYSLSVLNFIVTLFLAFKFYFFMKYRLFIIFEKF